MGERNGSEPGAPCYKQLIKLFILTQLELIKVQGVGVRSIEGQNALARTAFCFM